MPASAEFRVRLFGRDDLLQTIASGLGTHRGLVLHGPPGVGKSSLARAVCADVRDAVFVDLAPAESRGAFLEEVASVLGVKGPSELLEGRLGVALEGRGRTLLVLDDCERLAGEVAQAVAGWLEAAPELSVVLGSRIRIQLPNCDCIEVRPLPIPGSDEMGASPQPALELLAHEARVVGVEISGEDRAALVRVVRLLDGVPLALRIAARHLDVLSPGQLADRLERHLDFRAPVVGRHATMREAIAWSWSLLQTAERQALARCSVFEASFSTDAVESVLRTGADPVEPIALVEELCRHSLLAVEPGGEVRRYRLHRFVRSFASARLEEMDGGEALQRHDAYYASVAREFVRVFREPGDARVVERLAPEVPSMAAVVSRGEATDPRSTERALQCWLALSLILHPTRDVVWRQGLETVDRLLSSSAVVDADSRLWGEVSVLRCFLQMTAEPDAALVRTQEIIDRVRGVDPFIEGRAHTVRADALHFLGRYDEALGEHREALRWLAVGGVAVELARAECHMASTLKQWGDFPAAEKVLRSALERAESAGSTWVEVQARARLANIALDSGALSDALPQLERVLVLARAIGNEVFVGFALGCLAAIQHEQGELDAALQGYTLAVETLRRVGEPMAGEFAALQAVALWEMGRPDDARAAFSKALTMFGDAHYGAYRRLWSACLRALRGKTDDGLEGPETTQTAQALGIVRRLASVVAGDIDEDELAHWRRRHGPLISVEARVLNRVLAALIGEKKEHQLGREQPELIWNSTEMEFTLPGQGEPVSLRSHPTLWRVLELLVRDHQAHPGRRRPLEEVLRLAWPDERLLVGRARNRVYVAMSKLRRLGLARWLLRDERGYCLSPDLRITMGTRS